ncbi:recombinase RecA [Candidatus Roizmanbacteria bacterium CG10_big_fil_rev_8_21_14_0_10_45_7]|uniref:Protein RecA n=1 Tax=Candidatus Roizmanbacteria bacterium CG10_big_fil_rev_8_21_14_0_10_45_7 TaxID=1974854 RepID=A0A2M8KUD4_9BACT|nr:MAG: recombinase RecA [Candidatus Roizmanbacteria bacterium CG10_big_fil_rev_8_21_14_0_10_45_7]
MTDTKDPRAAAVEAAIEQIKQQFGKGAIMRMGDKTKEKIDVLPTGILALDDALGVGGIPRGRVVEIFGPEASGKTTVCLSIIAETQKQKGIAAFIDVEHALDPTWAQILGVNLENLLISQPDTAEQALEITEALIRSGGIDLVVIDSVAALVPRAEIEGEMGDSVMGMQARLMSQALRKLTGALSKSRTTAIFTNQLRQKIGIMFGNPETTPGGLALKFYASIRIDVRRIQVIKKGDEVVGSRARFKVIKNKVAPPFKQAEVTITPTGIDSLGSLVDLAVQKGIFAKSGSFLKYKGETIAQGVDQARTYLEEHPKLMHEIRSAVLAR